METNPPTDETSQVERIVADVRASRKYRNVCPDTIRCIAAEEWTKRDATRRAVKLATKATKSRLHQAYGAYEAHVDYDRAYRALQDAYAEGTAEATQMTCHRLLALHTSSRERRSILHRFYAEIFCHTGGVPRALLDLACGLNPLSLPWMGLDGEATYHAYDIDLERIAFLQRYFDLAGLRGEAHFQDVIGDLPAERADVALLLKSATCLERQRRGSVLALLDGLDVRYVVVTFPLKSLGRREKGMLAHYTRTFAEMTSSRPWTVTRLDFHSELVYVVDKT
jgi:16S rRNA (guanine(1405)-N(7))-methyltransferase